VVWERLNILSCDYDIKDVFEKLFCLCCCNSLLFAVFGTVVSAYFSLWGIDVSPYFWWLGIDVSAYFVLVELL